MNSSLKHTTGLPVNDSDFATGVKTAVVTVVGAVNEKALPQKVHETDGRSAGSLTEEVRMNTALHRLE